LQGLYQIGTDAETGIQKITACKILRKSIYFRQIDEGDDYKLPKELRFNRV
jgi:hypothetical protein